MNKYIIPIVAIIGIALGSGGTIAITKATQPTVEIPPVPDCICNCPPSTEVSLQNFDLTKLNNKKGAFTYAPSLHNVTIRIDAKDSVLIKQLLRSVK
jgi:hypothetical protein